MQIQIYVLYAVVALCAIVELYTMLICKEKFGQLEDAVERRVKQAGDVAVKIKEVDDVAKSLKVCASPITDLDHHCDPCIVTDDGSGECVSYLCKRAAGLLNEYKEMLEHGRT